jgi:N-acetyl-anhydromuramyl-L-alanine amidase AmpD
MNCQDLILNTLPPFTTVPERNEEYEYLFRRQHDAGRPIELLVVHCSATREDHTYTLEQLLNDHQRRGFTHVGYHFYIRRNGYIYATRPLRMPGAHCLGYNHNSIGICYEGGLDMNGQAKDTRTKRQRQQLQRAIALLCLRYPHLRVVGHRDLSPDSNGDGIISPNEWLKACPCFNVQREL